MGPESQSDNLYEEEGSTKDEAEIDLEEKLSNDLEELEKYRRINK